MDLAANSQSIQSVADIEQESAAASARTIAKGASISFVGIMAGNAARFASSALIARYLGPDAFGLFHLAKTVMAMSVRISISGWLQGASRFVAFYAGQGQKTKVKGTILFTSRVVGALSLVLGLLLFVLSNDIALILFQRPELGGLLRLVAVVIPFGALSELLVAQLVGFRALRYKLYARDLLGSLGLLVFLIILFRLSLEATGAILAYLASFLITGTVALLLLSQLMRRKGYAVSGRSSAVKGDILQFSWPLILTKLLMIVKNNFSSLWLGYALTADQVGLYGAVFVMEPVLTVIPMSFSDILLPSLSRSVAKGDLAASRSTYNTIRRWYIKLSVPLLLAVMVFPDAVIAVVYGNQYVESAAVLRLFCLAFLIPCLAGPWVMSLLSSGRTKAIMVTQIFGALLTIGFNLLLVPSYGILGAGIAYAVAIALPNLIGTALIYPSFRFRLIDMGMIKSIGLNVGMLLLVYLLRAHLLSEYSVWLMVPVLAAYWALAVVGSFAWDGLSRQDRAVLSSFLAKAGLLRLASQVGGE